ncbi:MAG: CoA transferase, partial [Chloroflexi bacterium]|nr:CoA transferase [Chloroflexota bacterium]
MPDAALDGIKVLDLTHHVAGPYCTKLLADFGAEVIKIERPGSGDPARRMTPFFHDEPHPEKSLPFLYLNTSKRSMTLDITSETGRSILKRLVQETDVLVESFSPSVLPSLGLDYESLREINPDLVMVSVTNFGQTG